MNLIDSLIRDGWLKTPRIIKAFKEIKRADFLPKDIRHLSDLDEALPIGFGQTISQPLVVAFMIEQLRPGPGDKILDIGSGSGWTSALLAHIVSGGKLKSKIKNQKSKIVAIEIIPELMEFGKQNVAKYNFIEKGVVDFICTDGSKGYEKEAPFDGILVSASLLSREIFDEWKKQLKIGARLVVPINYSIFVIEKNSNKDFKQKEYPGFSFVPFVQIKD